MATPLSKQPQYIKIANMAKFQRHSTYVLAMAPDVPPAALAHFARQLLAIAEPPPPPLQPAPNHVVAPPPPPKKVKKTTSNPLQLDEPEIKTPTPDEVSPSSAG